MIKIGDAVLKYGIMLAPMAGFSDSAMRTVCHKYGAEYSVTEMVSAKAVCYNDKKTAALARIREGEGKVAIQIFGSEPDVMARAAEALARLENSLPPSAIDINMGCPVPKVFSNGEGSALMKSPELIYKTVKAVSENIDIPCTVKMRTGVDLGSINAVECALAAEAGGAALIALHGRTRVEMYSGKANREIIKNVKQSLQIPVIANGDIQTAADAACMLKETGADGIMVGRGAIGNPFLFSEIKAVLSGGKYEPPGIDARVETALYQLSLAIADKGESVAVREARKQIALYLRSFRGAAAIRADINSAETFDDVKCAMRSCVSGSCDENSFSV